MEFVVETAYPPYVCKGCGRRVLPNSQRSRGEPRAGRRGESCENCAAWLKRHPGKTLTDCRDHRERRITVAGPGGDMEWQRGAECQWYPDEADMWHPLERGQSPRDSREVAMAKRICWKCPVMRECLEWSMANRETGVRGGTYLRNGKPWFGPKRRRARKVAAEKVAA